MVKNFGGKNFGEFGELKSICQVFSPHDYAVSKLATTTVVVLPAISCVSVMRVSHFALTKVFYLLSFLPYIYLKYNN